MNDEAATTPELGNYPVLNALIDARIDAKLTEFAKEILGALGQRDPDVSVSEVGIAAVTSVNGRPIPYTSYERGK